MPTALITGSSGYIAKHTVQRFLNAGYDVRGSVRSLERGDEVRAAVQPGLRAGVDDAALEFVALDLGSDDGWTEALEGIDMLVHTASPFPIAQPADENELIRPAVDGTLRALRAAHSNGVDRVVLTSSSAAIVSGLPARPDGSFDEDDWSDSNSPTISAYAKSKTLAERAAWGFVENEAPGLRLTTINPVFVLGAPLDHNYGSSINLIERIVRAKDPALPEVGFSVVDVGDIAEMHLRAAQRPETAGERIAGATRGMWFRDMAEVIRATYPDRKIVTRKAPKPLLRILARFDPEIKAALPMLGRIDEVDNSKAKTLLDMDFTDPVQSVRTSAAYIIDNNRV